MSEQDSRGEVVYDFYSTTGIRPYIDFTSSITDEEKVYEALKKNLAPK
ncbi:MAG: hypothetical protein RMJ15_00715 [Nitrososphaerota archaeon]|nr:hypothetical protein [Candidatus Bathyarchaeota archaeon]MDW8022254.1 hypothetical protein [Nitrososphaerota archaeon]